MKTKKPSPPTAQRLAQKPAEHRSEQRPAEQPWIKWAVALVACIVLFWAYAPSLHSVFLFDDTTQMFALPSVTMPLSHWIGPVRPALMFTYFVNSRISIDDTTSYHVFNIAIHALSGFFVWLVLRRLLAWANLPESRRGLFAGFGALLFLFHPLQTESVAYISGRSDSLCGMFAAASFAAFVCRRSVAISWSVTLLVVALFGAALLTKEQAVVLPVLFLLTDFWWNPGFSLRGALRNWKLYALLAAGALLGVWRFWGLIMGRNTGGSAGFGMQDLTWYQYLFTEFRAIVAYIFNFLLPVQLNVDWDFPISHTIFDRGSIFFLAALLAMAAAAWRYRKSFPLAGYGYFVFLILLLPTSSILPIQDPIADRRMYLPALGLILVAIDLLRRLNLEPKASIAFGVGLLLTAAVATHARAQVWSDPVSLWQDTERKSPEKVRAHFQLGFAYFEQARYDLAAAEFARSASLRPPTADLLLDWGLAYDGLHQPELALAKLREAIKLEASPQVYTQIAKVYAGSEHWPEALDALASAEKADPNYAITYIFRGKVFLKTNRPAEAIAQYQRALKLDPLAPDATHDLAIAQAMMQAMMRSGH
jgi:protein O-mannosyl-transferase